MPSENGRFRSVLSVSPVVCASIFSRRRLRRWRGDLLQPQFARKESRDLRARPQADVVRRLLQPKAQLVEQFGLQHRRRRAVAPAQVSQRFGSFGVVARRKLLDPARSKGCRLSDFANGVALGEKLDHMEVPRLTAVRTRNIPFTQCIRSNAQLSSP